VGEGGGHGSWVVARLVSRGPIRAERARLRSFGRGPAGTRDGACVDLRRRRPLCGGAHRRLQFNAPALGRRLDRDRRALVPRGENGHLICGSMRAYQKHFFVRFCIAFLKGRANV
jgi:hypothetical protein